MAAAPAAVHPDAGHSAAGRAAAGRADAGRPGAPGRCSQPMLAPVLALLLAAPAPAPACSLPPLAGPAPWHTGERLRMELSLLGSVKVGEVQFSVERPISGGAVIPLVSKARNTARFGPLQKLVAMGLSWVDARSLRPERYREQSDEDGRRRSMDVRFVPPGPSVTLDLLDGATRGSATFERQGEALDAVAAMYYLRATRLVAGDRICLDLVANGKYWRFDGAVARATERIEVPAGRFEAVRVEGTARRADGAGKSRAIWLWFSADARRLPLAVVSEVDLGMVSARLEEAG